jgi:hypothetical protein
MNSPQQQVSLSISFDYTELSECLYWKFLDQNGQPIEDRSGLYSGVFPLESGHSFGVQVHATGLPADAMLAVVDCNLVTLPVLYAQGNLAGGIPGTYPYPSPFFDPEHPGAELEGATTNFRTVNPFKPVLGAQRGTYEQLWVSETQRIVVNAGRWRTRFTLTLAIKTDGQMRYRVFNFDPETSSGSGGTPPR